MDGFSRAEMRSEALAGTCAPPGRHLFVVHGTAETWGKNYVVQALVQAHMLALIAFGIMVFTVLSFGIRVTLPRYQWGHKTQSV